MKAVARGSGLKTAHPIAHPEAYSAREALDAGEKIVALDFIILFVVRRNVLRLERNKQIAFLWLVRRCGRRTH